MSTVFELCFDSIRNCKDAPCLQTYSGTYTGQHKEERRKSKNKVLYELEDYEATATTDNGSDVHWRDHLITKTITFIKS